MPYGNLPMWNFEAKLTGYELSACNFFSFFVDRLGRFVSFCLVSRFISNWPNKHTLWRVQYIPRFVRKKRHGSIKFVV